MLNLTDFKKDDTAYMLIRHIGRNVPAEIKEVKVLSVSRKYVTVSYYAYEKKFKRYGNIEGLLEHADFGDLGVLYTSKAAAENEIERDRLMIEIRQNMRFMYKLSTEELKTINDMLCRR